MQGASLGMPLPFLCRACIGSRQKNAGGHPPALAGGKPPALGGPSIRGYRYLYSRSYVPGLRETFRPNLSKVILSEITVVSKKDLLGI